jgi:hypothetical protein
LLGDDNAPEAGVAWGGVKADCVCIGIGTLGVGQVACAGIGTGDDDSGNSTGCGIILTCAGVEMSDILIKIASAATGRGHTSFI